MNPIENTTQTVSFESILATDQLENLSKDLTELSIDSMMKEGFLRDIPFLNILVSSLNFTNSVNQYFFTKKIYSFLSQVQKIAPSKRNEIINKINDSNKYQNKVGENLLEILDRIESAGKPAIVGKLFTAVLEEKIEYSCFLKLAYIIEKQFYYDLLEVSKHIKNGKISGMTVNSSLHASELVSLDVLPSYNAAKNGEQLEATTLLTEYGRALLKFGMGVDIK